MNEVVVQLIFFLLGARSVERGRGSGVRRDLYNWCDGDQFFF